MNVTCGSNCRDPENRSHKKCVCGGHSAKKKRKRWSRDSLKVVRFYICPRCNRRTGVTVPENFSGQCTWCGATGEWSAK